MGKVIRLCRKWHTLGQLDGTAAYLRRYTSSAGEYACVSFAIPFMKARVRLHGQRGTLGRIGRYDLVAKHLLFMAERVRLDREGGTLGHSYHTAALFGGYTE